MNSNFMSLLSHGIISSSNGDKSDNLPDLRESKFASLFTGNYFTSKVGKVDSLGNITDNKYDSRVGKIDSLGNITDLTFGFKIGKVDSLGNITDNKYDWNWNRNLGKIDSLGNIFKK